jgi:TIR domain
MPKPQVFISYARQDAEAMEQLCSHLGASDAFEVWVDRELKGGDDWERKIHEAITRARLAILLVTSRFLNSKFIKNVEVPLIQQRSVSDGLIVFPIIARPCHWKGNRWLTQINVRPEGGVPIWEDVTRAEGHLARIAEEVARLLASEPPIVPPIIGPPERRGLQPIQSFEVAMPNLSLLATDERGRLWASDGEQVKVFRLGQAGCLERWPLPNVRWKQFLPAVWRGSVLFSDWDGSLYAFNGDNHDQGRPLYWAQSDDTPIHRLAVGAAGHLVAAAWNGVVRAWDREGHPRGGAPIRVPYLPTHVLSPADHSLVVADQGNNLRRYDPSGREVWSWRSSAPVLAHWACQEEERFAILAQEGRLRLLKVGADSRQPETVDFREPIVGVSRREGGTSDEWALVVREGGQIDWCSVSPFRVVKESHLVVPFAVRQLTAVRDPQQPASFIAVGLSAEGKLFTVKERSVQSHISDEKFERLLVGPTGHFLFLLAGDVVHVIRNPALLPVPCEAAVAGVSGVLKVDEFSRITVQIRNTGKAVIQNVRAHLHAEGRLDPCENSNQPAVPFYPGQTIPLEFAARPRVAGQHVPVNLRLELEDEGGPPVWDVGLRLEIESRS